MALKNSDKMRILTQDEINRSISDGVTKMIVVDGTVYDVTNYANR